MTKDAPTARRLRTLRKALGYDRSLTFAAFLGCTNSRLNNVENGWPLGIDLAMTIVTKTGVTLDWLYYGKPDGLTVDMARRLGAFGTQPAERSVGSTKRK